MRVGTVMEIKRAAGLGLCLLALVGLLRLTATCQAGAVFADSGLEAAVRDNLDRPAGMIARTELRRITHLDASGRNIARLDGIEHLRRLTALNLENNHVRDVSPLRGLDQLTELNLRDNRIHSLAGINFQALAHLPLRHLNLRDNWRRPLEGPPLAEVPDRRLADIALLAPLVTLEELLLRGNHIADLSPLAGLLHLRRLDAGENRIADLSPLRGLHALRELDLRANRIKDITALGGLRNLRDLNLRTNAVSDLAPLAGLDALRDLDLRDNRIADIGPLAGLPDLRDLNLRANGVADLAPLGGLQSLATLNLRGNLVVDISPLEGLTSLRRLNLGENSLACLAPLAGLYQLAYLNLQGNRQVVSTAPLAGLAGLETLALSGVPVRDGLLEPVLFSHHGGVHSEEIALRIRHPDPEAVILYTLDGSAPDPAHLNGATYRYKNSFPHDPGDPFGNLLSRPLQSRTYTQPIPLQDRSPQPDGLTRISSTNDLHPWYFPATPVHKGTVVRARAFKDGTMGSPETAGTFFVRPKGQAPTLPVISLIIQENQLFGYEEGIYTAGVDWDEWRKAHPWSAASPCGRPANFHRRGSAWEYPAYLEIFAPGDRTPVVSQGVGFRIHGNWSRGLPLKNLRLYSRARHDEADYLRLDLFRERVAFASRPANTAYKRLLLRGQGNGGPVFYDVVFHRLLQPVYEGMSRHEPAILYMNGEYWGLTAIRDRLDRYHFALHYGLAPENIVMIWKNRLDSGRPADQDLFDGLYQHIVRQNMADDTHFALVERQMCLRSFVDHLIAHVHAGNTHYEHGFWRVREVEDEGFGDGRWRTYVQDFDQVLVDKDFLSFKAGVGGDDEHWWQGPSELFVNLLENERFRNFFINRFADHLNTTFAPERFLSIIDSTYQEVQGYLAEDHHRSGRRLYTRQERDSLATWAMERPDTQRSHIRKLFEIANDIAITLTVSDHRHGHLRINSIAIKGDTPGVGDAPYPWTGIYFSDIPVELEAYPASGYQLVGWKVNGAAAEASRNGASYPDRHVLAVTLTEDTVVEAVFGKPAMGASQKDPAGLTVGGGRQAEGAGQENKELRMSPGAKRLTTGKRD